jgi:16S rRNA G966 N2-methylase RsmD
MDGTNKLYFGDNLKILRDYVPDASVDLIYLDPPFNSHATYNVLFKEKSGEESAAQLWMRGQEDSDPTRRLFERLMPRHHRSRFTNH